MSRPGWVKVYNQTLDSDFWIDPAPFSHRDAFFYVLLSANWRPGVTRRNGHVREIKRGQLLTSLRKLQAAFHWGSTDRVNRWLNLMHRYGMIERENLEYGTLLTVVNYDKFQGGPDTPKDTLEDSPKDTVEDTPMDTPMDKVAVRSKTIDYRQQTTDSISAFADDDDDDDDGAMDPEEARKVWESLNRLPRTSGE